MFQPFATTKANGTGLGLAIVQKVIVSHNGRIAAANRAEGGAQFRLRLPVATRRSACQNLHVSLPRSASTGIDQHTARANRRVNKTRRNARVRGKPCPQATRLQQSAVCHQPNRYRGFTLVETVVATGVLVTALAGLAQLFILSEPPDATGRARPAVALAAAQQKLESLRGLGVRGREDRRAH